MRGSAQHSVKELAAQLLRKSAIPGWLLIAFGVLRSVFSTWSEIEFFWTKVTQFHVVQFVVQNAFSPLVLNIAGFLWLGWLVLRPVTTRWGAAAPKFHIQAYGGENFSVVLNNNGGPADRVWATAQLLENGTPFKRKRPFWLAPSAEPFWPMGRRAQTPLILARKVPRAVEVLGDNRSVERIPVTRTARRDDDSPPLELSVIIDSEPQPRKPVERRYVFMFVGDTEEFIVTDLTTLLED